jgi:hypothetical protein
VRRVAWQIARVLSKEERGAVRLLSRILGTYAGNQCARPWSVSDTLPWATGRRSVHGQPHPCVPLDARRWPVWLRDLTATSEPLTERFLYFTWRPCSGVRRKQSVQLRTHLSVYRCFRGAQPPATGGLDGRLGSVAEPAFCALSKLAQWWVHIQSPGLDLMEATHVRCCQDRGDQSGSSERRVEARAAKSVLPCG